MKLITVSGDERHHTVELQRIARGGEAFDAPHVVLVEIGAGVQGLVFFAHAQFPPVVGVSVSFIYILNSLISRLKTLCYIQLLKLMTH